MEITSDSGSFPTWHEPPAQATKVIRLDPGLAFGTGAHPTTRMCLRWIARQDASSLTRVLDYGCGSGILAIGAAKYGAADIDAVDIDEAAVQSTLLNAEGQPGTAEGGLARPGGGRLPDGAGQYPGHSLKVLAPLLCAHVAPGGSLVLAGILERQVDELKSAYAPWAVLDVADREDGWALMTAQI